MDFFKKIWNNKLKSPHGVWLCLFYIFSVLAISGTIVLVILKPEQTVLHYLSYIIAAICLTYTVYTIVIFSPKIRCKIIEKFKKHKFTNQLLNDYGFRTMIFATLSFIFNLAYVAFIGTLGIITKSVWYICITIYYITLIVMKGNIFLSKRRHNTEIKKARAYRFCGIMFIFLTLALSGIIVLIYKSNMYFEYAGLLIYFVATYTFYNLTLSIINIIKAQKHDNLYIQSIKNINLASSLVSIIVLQVSMFQAFAPEYNTSFANGLTGAIMSLIILSLGIYMIVKANKKLKNINADFSEQEVKEEQIQNNFDSNN